MTLELYTAPYSSATRVHWAVVELDVPVTLHVIDFKAKAHREPAYLALNPNGKVPLLVVDGKPLWESLAILGYLGDRFGVGKQLWPAPDDARRLDALSWLVWSSTELGSAIGRYHLAVDERSSAEHRAPALVSEATDALRAQLAILEGRLAGRAYVLGEAFSLVDIAIASGTWWLTFLKFDFASYPNVAAWTARCTQRPALAKIMG